MKQIRKNVFETNSSSTHSITMCLESEYTAWNNGQMWLYNTSWKRPKDRSLFFNWEDIIKFIREVLDCDEETINEIIEAKNNKDEGRLEDLLADEDFYSASKYDCAYEEYEFFEESITTPSGDKIIAFGYYGENY